MRIFCRYFGFDTVSDLFQQCRLLEHDLMTVAIHRHRFQYKDKKDRQKNKDESEHQSRYDTEKNERLEGHPCADDNEGP